MSRARRTLRRASLLSGPQGGGPRSSSRSLSRAPTARCSAVGAVACPHRTRRCPARAVAIAFRAPTVSERRRSQAADLLAVSDPPGTARPPQPKGSGKTSLAVCVEMPLTRGAGGTISCTRSSPPGAVLHDGEEDRGAPRPTARPRGRRDVMVPTTTRQRRRLLCCDSCPSGACRPRRAPPSAGAPTS